MNIMDYDQYGFSQLASNAKSKNDVNHIISIFLKYNDKQKVNALILLSLDLNFNRFYRGFIRFINKIPQL